MKRTTRSALMDAQVRLTASQVAKGFFVPDTYTPMNREQRRDLEKARKRAKK